MRYIKLRHTVRGAEWLEERGQWKLLVEGPDGKVFEDYCEFFLNGGGILK